MTDCINSSQKRLWRQQILPHVQQQRSRPTSAGSRNSSNSLLAAASCYPDTWWCAGSEQDCGADSYLWCIVAVLRRLKTSTTIT